MTRKKCDTHQNHALLLQNVPLIRISLLPQRESLVVGDEEEATGFKGDGGMVDIVGPRDSAGPLSLQS